MHFSTHQRITLRLAFVLVAVFVGAACADDCNEESASTRLQRIMMRNREAAVRTVTPGRASTTPVVTATVTPPPANLRYATIEHITAVFDQSKFTTTYTLKVVGALPEGLYVEWSGPNCGEVVNQIVGIDGLERADDVVHNVTFTWKHPHPPCANASDHSNVTVVAQATEGGSRGNTPRLVTICTYPGSASGTGPACQLTQPRR